MLIKIFIILGLCLTVIVAVLLIGNKNNQSNSSTVIPSPNTKNVSPTPSNKPVQNLTNIKKVPYQLGVGYFALNSNINNSQAMSKISEVAHLAYIQRHWKESLNDNQSFYSEISREAKEARNKGLGVYIAFEVLSADRSKLELPASLQGNFSDNRVREEYLNTVKKIAADFHPEYFILNVEANRYKKDNPDDYLSYKTLYLQAYDAVKLVSPQTKTSVSISYEDYNDRNCFDQSDKNQFKNYLNDFSGKSDLLAVSVYPTCYLKPSAIPDSFIKEIADLSDLKLFIAETGWMSEGFSISPSFNFSSSQASQAEFVEKLMKSANIAVLQSKNIEAINYIAIVDPGSAVCQAIKDMAPSLGWYCTLALIDEGGQEKSAFQKMKVWKSSLSK